MLSPFQHDTNFKCDRCHGFNIKSLTSFDDSDDKLSSYFYEYQDTCKHKICFHCIERFSNQHTIKVEHIPCPKCKTQSEEQIDGREYERYLRPIHVDFANDDKNSEPKHQKIQQEQTTSTSTSTKTKKRNKKKNRRRNRRQNRTIITTDAKTQTHPMDTQQTPTSTYTSTPSTYMPSVYHPRLSTSYGGLSMISSVGENDPSPFYNFSQTNTVFDESFSRNQRIWRMMFGGNPSGFPII